MRGWRECALSNEREITNRQFVSLSQETKMVETGGVSASVEKERERARAGGGITVVAVIRNERKRNGGGEGDNTSTPLRPSVRVRPRPLGRNDLCANLDLQ